MTRMIRMIILMLRMIILMGQDDGSWFMAHGSRFMAHGSWLMAHGQGGPARAPEPRGAAPVRPGPAAHLGSGVGPAHLGHEMIILIIPIILRIMKSS